VPHSSRLIRRGIYPAIDLVFHANQGRLEYDFVLSPHANPKEIRISWTGADHQSVGKSGDLVVRVGSNTLTSGKPAVFQQSVTCRIDVPGHFVIDNKTGEAVSRLDSTIQQFL
jgi:hypothetical protein